MSKTTRTGVYTGKRKHDARDNTNAMYYKGIAYVRPTVVLRERKATISLREQVADLLDTSAIGNPWPQDHLSRRWTSQSRDYVFMPAERITWTELWEVERKIRLRDSTPLPVIEHKTPKQVRLNVSFTLWELREVEAKGDDTGYARGLRERHARERREALKREDIARFGRVRSLA
jgi:hypothetical protein